MSAPSREASVPPPVRRASLQDLEALTAIWIEITQHHRAIDPLYTLRPGAAAEVKRLLRSMLEASACAVFVADPGGRVEGMSCVRIDRAPPILEELERAEITDLGVRRASRRRGIGRALALAALGWVRERGVGRVEVRVAKGNAEGRAFWRSLGFGDHVEVLQRRTAG